MTTVEKLGRMEVGTHNLSQESCYALLLYLKNEMASNNKSKVYFICQIHVPTNYSYSSYKVWYGRKE